MILLRRAILIVLWFAVPLLLTWLMSMGVDYLLFRLERYVAPDTLRLARYGEFLLFFAVCFLEVRDRW